MKVILFGGTGMVGQAILAQCLADARVEGVLAVGRSPIPMTHAKLRQVVHPDMSDLSPIADEIRSYDAVFDALGVSSFRMDEAAYTRLTYDLTIGLARSVRDLCGPETTFIYVSGASTDSTESGRVMWARVKGRTENALKTMLPHAYMFRPGAIAPVPGVKSKTRWLAAIHVVTAPLIRGLAKVAPGIAIDSATIGRAMINVAAGHIPPGAAVSRILESRDIVAAGGA
ncbi:MAG: NAD-dependent epimerase/dehydratase family protein [Knoellia sp.]